MNENKTFNWIHLQCEAPLARPLLQPQLSPATPMPSAIVKQPMITDSTIENERKGEQANINQIRRAICNYKQAREKRGELVTYYEAVMKNTKDPKFIDQLITEYFTTNNVKTAVKMNGKKQTKKLNLF